MSSPFLLRFSRSLIDRLIGGGLLQVPADKVDDLVESLALHLAQVQVGSLITSVSTHLMRSELVDELYADDDDIKAVVDAMDRRDAGL